MTLLEALIALGIAAFTIGGAIEAFQLAATRSTMSTLEIEATSLASNLVATADIQSLGHFVGRNAQTGSQWHLDIVSNASEPSAIDVSATVRITRGGLVAEKTIATLKVQ